MTTIHSRALPANLKPAQVDMSDLHPDAKVVFERVKDTLELKMTVACWDTNLKEYTTFTMLFPLEAVAHLHHFTTPKEPPHECDA